MKNVNITLESGENARAAGNIELLDAQRANDRYAFAGARYGLTEASRAWTRAMVDVLSPDKHILVSGLAVGSDTDAHEAALEKGVPQVAVLPSGLNNIYPRENRRLARRIVNDGGVLVSLWPDEAGAARERFLRRNRLIIDLSRLLVVNQFNWPSGTLNTVNNAKKAGKLIIVQNGNYTGNRRIIEDGTYKTIIK